MMDIPRRRLATMAGFDSNSPDGLLVAAALAGEPEAFGLLARRYAPALVRVALSRLGRRELAEEAVQETLLCAHRWLATYDSRFSFRTWLWTILLHQCTRHARREARYASGGADYAQVSIVDSSQAGAEPLHVLLNRERSERIHQTLARLPVAQADALRLRFFGGLTFAEIAAAMHCSEAGAKNRVKTGLLKLAEWLKPKETFAYRIERGSEERTKHEAGKDWGDEA
jgi:RNA polymerase sigma-70 factor, ECF subfamily